MKTISTDFSFFIEHDMNPFILYSHQGEILYLNQSAEILMGIHTKNEIFNIAITHAPQSFGHKRTLMELAFSSFKFYAINVLYENEEQIGIHLYTRPRSKLAQADTLKDYIATDLNLLLQSSIELFNINYNGKLTLLTDNSLPEILMHQNNFSIMLRKIFTQFQNSSFVDMELSLKIGSKVIIEEQDYTILSLRFKVSYRDNSSDSNIKALATPHYINISFKDESVTLEIPFIKTN